jgi:hypothetical protein
MTAQKIAHTTQGGVNVTQLAEKHSVHRLTVAGWLKEAKLKPVFSMPYGRGFMEIFDAEAATAVVLRRMPKAPLKPADVAPAAVAHGVGMAVFQAAMDTNDERLLALQTTCTKLVDQNVILLRTLSNLGERFAVMEKELGVKNGA